MGRFPLPTEKQRHQIVQHRKNYEMNLSASLRMQAATQRGTSAPPKVCKFLLFPFFLEVMYQNICLQKHIVQRLFLGVRMVAVLISSGIFVNCVMIF